LDQRSASARRYRDLVANFTSDAGGDDVLSEAQRQLVRRAASLSFACEALEAQIIAGAPAEFKQSADGLSPHDILQESARILHGVARYKGGGADGTVRQFASLPDAEMARVSDLLMKAGDLSHKAIAAGSERMADLELLATLSARLVRVLAQLGIRRSPRDVSRLNQYLSERYPERAADIVEEPADETTSQAGTPFCEGYAPSESCEAVDAAQTVGAGEREEPGA
jgi:hypothetical protein